MRREHRYGDYDYTFGAGAGPDDVRIARRRAGSGRFRSSRGVYAREPRGEIYGRAWTDTADLDERMGMHDLTEHYGRYSGGGPYGYEYSERSIEHRHPEAGGFIGFTRPLKRRPAAPQAYTAEFAQHARTGVAPWPRQAWEGYEPRPRPETARPPREPERPQTLRSRAYGLRRGRDRYWTFRGNRYWR